MDADVIIHKLRSSLKTSKGVMTFGSLGEKPRSSTRTYDMVRVFPSAYLHSMSQEGVVLIDIEQSSISFDKFFF